jgi:hypothetical protein
MITYKTLKQNENRAIGIVVHIDNIEASNISKTEYIIYDNDNEIIIPLQTAYQDDNEFIIIVGTTVTANKGMYYIIWKIITYENHIYYHRTNIHVI